MTYYLSINRDCPHSFGAVAYGAYMKKMQELDLPVDFQNPNPEALEYAQLMMRRTQSSAFFKDVPPAISRGTFSGNRSLDRAIFQFQTFILNRWNTIRHDLCRVGIMGGVRDIKDRDFPKALDQSHNNNAHSTAANTAVFYVTCTWKFHSPAATLTN